ncbi:hypothetical protein BC828DRAFT_182559 [Blastocladiella britannica]|nr:hypothetical protein BC828DRAFT_182559 [Blastocladiella britannica]
MGRGLGLGCPPPARTPPTPKYSTPHQVALIICIIIKDESVGNADRYASLAAALLAILLRWTELVLGSRTAPQSVRFEHMAHFLAVAHDLADLASQRALPVIVQSLLEALPRLNDIRAAVGADTATELSLGMTSLIKAMWTAIEPALYPNTAVQLAAINDRAHAFGNSSLNRLGWTFSTMRPEAEPATSAIAATTTAVTDGAIDYNAIYDRMWPLLRSLPSPRELVTKTPLPNFAKDPDQQPKIRPSVKQCMDEINAVVVDLVHVSVLGAQEHQRHPGRESIVGAPGSIMVDDQWPLYLQSRETFEDQVQDPKFRREVLVQLLLVCETFLIYSAERVDKFFAELAAQGAKHAIALMPKPGPLRAVYFTPDEIALVQKVRASVAIALSRIPPYTAEFLDMIVQLVREEASWFFWKIRLTTATLAGVEPMTTDLPPLELSSIPAAFEQHPVSLGNARMDELLSTSAPAASASFSYALLVDCKPIYYSF